MARITLGVLGMLILAVAMPAHAQPYEGFGATTAGGAGGAVVRVTSLANTGRGTLRAALAGGRRTVIFEVAGEIALTTPLTVKSRVTLNGSSAPPPGITLRGRGLVLRGARDVIIRDIRVREAAGDCIQVGTGASRIVIDHVSVSGCGDGNIDVTQSADVTVSWSLLAEPASRKQMLIKYRPTRITLHHNLLLLGQQRNPQISREGDPPARETTVDMRNNVVWDWGFGYGTFAMFGPWVNVVGNYYENPGGESIDTLQALLVCRGDGVESPESSPACPAGGAASAARVYASGNLSGDGVDVDARGTSGTPFPAPAVTTQDACTAARLVVAGAGARPTDGLDLAYRARVHLSACGN